jgi:hypothetical protein
MSLNNKKSRGRVASLIAVLTVIFLCGQAPSAEALGSGKFAWRGDDAKRTVYYFYGSGGRSGSFAYASTNAPGRSCLLYVKRVKTRITLPNGGFASDSSLLGQCSSGVEISAGQYSVFEIKSTHTLQKWSGAEYNYVL